MNMFSQSQSAQRHGSKSGSSLKIGFSSDSEDEEAKGPSSLKRLCPGYSNNDTVHKSDNGNTQEPQDLSLFRARAATFEVQAKKKVNHIWGSVINQQIMSEVSSSVTGLDIEKGAYGVENRGIENYITRLMRKRTHDDQSRGSAVNTGDNESSELSSGGLSDDSKRYCRERKKKFRKTIQKSPSAEAAVMAADTPMYLSQSLKDQDVVVDTAQTSKTVQPVQQPNPQPKKYSSFLRQKMMDMDDLTLGHFLCTRMREKNRDLIVRAVNFLGKKACVQLYFKLTKIERNGGLLIKSQARRRTKGGVFLYLIRNDKRLPQHLVESLFEEERIRRVALLNKKEDGPSRSLTGTPQMDALQLRMHQRLSTESVGVQEERKAAEKRVSCDIDNEDFTFSIDKLVHNRPGFIAQEGPKDKRQQVVYDSFDLF